jgi:hypothetical protein
VKDNAPRDKRVFTLAQHSRRYLPLLPISQHQDAPLNAHPNVSNLAGIVVLGPRRGEPAGS